MPFVESRSAKSWPGRSRALPAMDSTSWFDVSSSWERILLFVMPVITIGVGLLVAFLMRRRTPSGLAFFFWFTAADAVLTLAIYGVTILGVF